MDPDQTVKKYVDPVQSNEKKCTFGRAHPKCKTFFINHFSVMFKITFLFMPDIRYPAGYPAEEFIKIFSSKIL